MGAEGVPIVYGSADDVDLVAELPLASARWVVSTIPDVDVSRTLVQALRDSGFEGDIAVTGNDPENVDALLTCGANHVFVPLLHAAHETARVLGAQRDVGSIEADPQTGEAD